LQLWGKGSKRRPDNAPPPLPFIPAASVHRSLPVPLSHAVSGTANHPSCQILSYTGLTSQKHYQLTRRMCGGKGRTLEKRWEVGILMSEKLGGISYVQIWQFCREGERNKMENRSVLFFLHGCFDCDFMGMAAMRALPRPQGRCTRPLRCTRARGSAFSDTAGNAPTTPCLLPTPCSPLQPARINIDWRGDPKP